jgi:hypothetical protein
MASFSFKQVDFHSKTEKKVLKFVYDLMSKYKQVESESTSDYIYICHNEFDGNNVSEFEGLSNGNYIVVKTKLNLVYMPTIMRMFQSIYDDNYWPYEDLENECYSCDMYLSEVYDYDIDGEIPEEHREIREKLLNYDVDEWFKLLTSYAEKKYKLKHNKDEDSHYVEEERIFYEPPKKNYYEEDKYEVEKDNESNLYTQKFYTLDNILEMLENDMKSTVRKASRNLV